jgi:Ca-activated chloride channel family protein
MNEKSFEAKLARVKAPAPDPEARLRAKRAALEEFARVNTANQDAAKDSEASSKGLWDALRLFRDDSSHGSTSMAWFVRRNLFAGVAGACVVGLGIALVWPIYSNYGDSRLFDELQPPVTVELKPEKEPGKELRKDDRLTASEPAPEPVPVPAPAEPKLQKNPRQEALAAASASASAAAAARDKREAETYAFSPPETVEIDEAQAQIAEQPSPQPEIVVEGIRRPLAQAQKSVSPAVVIAAEEISVTGARARSRQPAHKGMAPATPGSSGRVAANVYTPPAPPPLASMAVGALERDASKPAVDEGRDQFEKFDVNPVRQVAAEPVSTFSADVDTASYSFVRRQLTAGRLPQKDSVRVEEMINYFDYAWPAATSAKAPFKPTVVVSDSPWGKGRKLVHIGIKGYEVSRENAPGANLVLLLDVSGSMDSPDKLPLAVQSMELLLSSLKPTDTVGIVVYAGAAGTVLEPTPVGNKQKIIAALRDLRPGGSTAGAEGIERAYQLAEAHFRKGGVNRILLATDGDFNVGIAGTNELKGFVERKREKGIFLSVLGFGQGNYRDELAQALAQNGNGVAAYIDTLGEAQKVLVQEAGASLFTIAKDVKLQVEFNPATVAEYRLIGYETRALKREDFNNDAVDAGDVGSGHTVTAIYEITPVGSAARMVDKSRYAKEAPAPVAAGNASEYGFLKIRYKLPESSTSELIEQPILMASRDVPENIQRDVQFSTAVAGFGQLLRGGAFTGAMKYDDIIKQAQAAKGEDAFGYRTEFVQLVRKAKVAREM